MNTSGELDKKVIRPNGLSLRSMMNIEIQIRLDFEEN